MTKIFSDIETQTEGTKTKVSLAELLCFVFLFAGLMIILVPSSQRRSAPLSATSRYSAGYHLATAHSAAAKSNVAVVGKTAVALNGKRIGSKIR